MTAQKEIAPGVTSTEGKRTEHISDFNVPQIQGNVKPPKQLSIVLTGNVCITPYSITVDGVELRDIVQEAYGFGSYEDPDAMHSVDHFGTVTLCATFSSHARMVLVDEP